MKAATSEEKFRLELSRTQAWAGCSLFLQMVANLSRFAAPSETELRGLRTALDPDISDQHQPQVVPLSGGGRVRPLVSWGGQEAAGGEPPPSGRGGADLLRVEP